MPKFTVRQLMQFIEDNGSVYAKDFNRIGFNSGNVHAYLRDRIKNDNIQIDKDGFGKKYSLTDKGREYLRLSNETAAVPSVVVPLSSEHGAVRTQAEPTLDDAIDALCQAIVVRISTTVENQIGTMVDRIVTKQVMNTIHKMTTGIASLPSAQAVAPVTPKKKALIVGLLPDQQHFIQKEFGGDYDMRFVGSNESSGLLKANAAHSDVVFLMTDFISHSTVELIKPFNNMMLVKGGMSSLRDALTRFYVGE